EPYDGCAHREPEPRPRRGEARSRSDDEEQQRGHTGQTEQVPRDARLGYMVPDRHLDRFRGSSCRLEDLLTLVERGAPVERVELVARAPGSTVARPLHRKSPGGAGALRRTHD